MGCGDCMEQIQFIGLNELEKVDQDMVQTLATEYYEKIKRSLHNETSLVIHIKPAAKEGHRHRYEVSVRVAAPTRTFESSAEDWDLAAVIHKTLKELLSQIEHAFHT